MNKNGTKRGSTDKKMEEGNKMLFVYNKNGNHDE